MLARSLTGARRESSREPASRKTVQTATRLWRREQRSTSEKSGFFNVPRLKRRRLSSRCLEGVPPTTYTIESATKHILFYNGFLQFSGDISIEHGEAEGHKVLIFLVLNPVVINSATLKNTPSKT